MTLSPAIFLVYVKNIVLLAHVKKMLPASSHIIMTNSLEDAKKKLSECSIQLLLIEGASFFSEALALASWMRLQNKKAWTPTILLEPPCSIKEKKEAIKAGIRTYIYNVFDEKEWESKIDFALKRKACNQEKGEFSKNNSALTTFPCDILEDASRMEKTFTILITLRPLDKSLPKSKESLIQKKLAKELAKLPQKNGTLIPGKNGSFQIVLAENSSEKAAKVAAHLLKKIPHTMQISLEKHGKITPEDRKKFAMIVEKILQNNDEGETP